MSKCICNLINSGMVDGVQPPVSCQYHATTKINIFHTPSNVPRKFSWVSVKDWFRAWWKRNVIDDYPYMDAM